MPGAPPPAELQARLAAAAADPSTTGYGPIVGDLVLRQALAKDLKRVYGTEHVTEENVNVTAGCNMVSIHSLPERAEWQELTPQCRNRRRSTRPSSRCARRETR